MSAMSIHSRLNQTDMIINSSEGKDLLPSSYTNNDFDGLFENEATPFSNENHDHDGTCTARTNSNSSAYYRDLINPSCSSAAALRSTFSSSSCPPRGQRYDFQQNQRRRRQQEKPERSHHGEDLFSQKNEQGHNNDHNVRSLIIQKHLERARLCLNQANARDHLKANTVLNYCNILKNKVSIQMTSNEDVCSTKKTSDFEQPKEMGGFRQTNQESSVPQQAPFQENNIVTTPLLSHLFESKNDDEEGQDSPRRKKRNIDLSSLCNKSSVKYSRQKRVCTHTCSLSFSGVDVSGNRSQPKIPKSHRYVKTVASQLPRHQEEKHSSSYISSPLESYTKVLNSRSYNNKCYFQSSSRYYSKPSKLQKASFGNAILDVVHRRDCESLKELILCGLSPNPCNQFGDSVLNTICKRGHEDVFHTLMDCGASILTCDHFGRTPLHFVCWSSNFCPSVVEKILSVDVHMLRATDKVGKTPLDYVSRQNWENWNEFLKIKEETFWPENSAAVEDLCTDSNKSEHEGRRDSLPNPKIFLSEDIAKQISSGSLTAQELAKCN